MKESIGGSQDEIEKVSQKINMLQNKNRIKKYVGLNNQGATCYMNSAIQTLYMTPEFRKSIYQWKFNPELHGKKEFSIPYQLQKLFAELQLSRRDFVDTRSLTNSFGWNSHESFEQQDVQEFFRVLFEAIEKSFEMAGEQYQVVNELYQGQMTSYVHCKKCNNESNNTDQFLDIQLPIKNEFGTGVINSSLEMALENYLKPDVLEGENQYQCSKCEMKVDALKGLRLGKCPQILSLSLNRFTLDYNTFMRVKITDRVSFPFTLNMNDYMKGYEGIQNKLYDNEVQRIQKYSAKTIDKNVQAEQLKKKVLQEKRMEKEQIQKENQDAKQDNVETDQQINSTQIENEKQNSKTQEKGIKIQVQKEQNENIIQQNSQEEEYTDSYNPYMFDVRGPKKVIDYSNNKGDENYEEFEDLEQEIREAFVNDSFQIVQKENLQQQQQLQEEKELAEALEQIRRMEESQKISKPLENQLEEFISHGEYVYELFSILIHQGSAMGGHYYAYIKSFEDQKWYEFNDSNVQEIQSQNVIQQIQKMFGGDSNSSAYMLQYRKYNPDVKQNLQVENELIPEYLKEDIDKDTDELIKQQLMIEQNLLRIQLKVHEPQSRDNYKMIVASKTQTLREFINIIQEQTDDHFCGVDYFKSIQPQNYRIRQYDPKFKLKLQVYQDISNPEKGIENSYDKKLMQLGFYSHFEFKIEVKEEGQEFEEYNPDWVYLQLWTWNRFVDVKQNLDLSQSFDIDNLTLDLKELAQYPYELIKVDVTNDKISNLESIISQKTNIPIDKLVIIIRHEPILSGDIRIEYFNYDKKQFGLDKKINEMKTKLNNGHILFIEQQCEPEIPYEQLNWYKIMQNEVNLINLYINTTQLTPEKLESSLQIKVSKNSTLKQLKQLISKRLSVDPESFTVRRQNVQAILKQEDFTIQQLGIGAGALLKAEKGQASGDSKFKIQVKFIRLIPEEQQIFIYENFDGTDDSKEEVLCGKTQLGFIFIDSNITVKELKSQIFENLIKDREEMKNIIQNEDQFRLRYPKNDDLGDVLFEQQKCTIGEICHLFDGQEILVQETNHKNMIIDFKEQHSYNILVREWRPDTWEFGPLYEVQVQKTITCNKLAEFLQKNIFPHIELNQLFGTQINLSKQFIRSDLALKRWQSLAAQKTWIGQSNLEINRDSLMVVVKDQQVKLKDLVLGVDEIKILRWASKNYIEHLIKKQEQVISGEYSKSKNDDLFQASQSNKYSNVPSKPMAKEKGVKIMVGQGFVKDDAKIEAQQMSENDKQSNQIKKDDQVEEEDEFNFIGALF